MSIKKLPIDVRQELKLERDIRMKRTCSLRAYMNVLPAILNKLKTFPEYFHT